MQPRRLGLGFGRGGLASIGIVLVEGRVLGAAFGGLVRRSNRESEVRGATVLPFHGVPLTVVGKTTCVSGKLSPTFK